MRSLLLAFVLCGTAAAQTPLIQPNIFVAEGAARTHGFTMVVPGASLGVCRIDACGGSLTLDGVAIDPINVFVAGSQVSVFFQNDFPAGPADLELRLPSRTIRVADAITFVANADYETILLPHTPGEALPGANGSNWRVEMLLRNDSPYSLRFDLPMHPRTLISPPPPDWFVVPPQTTANVNLFSLTGPARVRVPKIAAKDVVFETRFYDEARLGTNFGTRVPTVREHEFRHGVTTIPGVPLGTGFRSTVRVFSPDGERRVFRVRVLSHPVLQTGAWEVPPIQPVVGELLATYTARAEYTDAVFKEGGPWSAPMASIPVPDFPGHTRVQVQLDVVDAADAPYWAYVSVTNNETQQVTLLTP
jgi:hypothetical protein